MRLPLSPTLLLLVALATQPCRATAEKMPENTPTGEEELRAKRQLFYPLKDTKSPFKPSVDRTGKLPVEPLYPSPSTPQPVYHPSPASYSPDKASPFEKYKIKPSAHAPPSYQAAKPAYQPHASAYKPIAPSYKPPAPAYRPHKPIKDYKPSVSAYKPSKPSYHPPASKPVYKPQPPAYKPKPYHKPADHYHDTEDHNPIPGVPGKDYPVYHEVPYTKFSCDSVPHRPGIYANPEAGCQAYHVCHDGRYGEQGSGFLCTNGTLFNQETFNCDWWFNVDCSKATYFYSLNSDPEYNPFNQKPYDGPLHIPTYDGKPSYTPHDKPSYKPPYHEKPKPSYEYQSPSYRKPSYQPPSPSYNAPVHKPKPVYREETPKPYRPVTRPPYKAPIKAYAKPPVKPSYKPLPTAAPVYKPRPTPSVYKPQFTRPVYKSPSTSPPYKPRHTSPTYKPLPTSPTYKPRPTSTYKPRPTSPAYKPRPTSTYKPRSTSPAYKSRSVAPYKPPKPSYERVYRSTEKPDSKISEKQEDDYKADLGDFSWGQKLN